jgi:hypothetical protein
MVGKSKGFFVVALGLGVGLSLCGSLPAAAQSIEEKTQVCAGCHGESGKPIDKTIPVIWGQQQVAISTIFRVTAPFPGWQARARNIWPRQQPISAPAPAATIPACRI